jgi:hypothetical protein
LLKEAMKVTDEKNREFGGFIYCRGDGKFPSSGSAERWVR